MARPETIKSNQQTIIQLLDSIFLEEAGLAALIHSEAEKLKAVVIYLETGAKHRSAEELLALQCSFKSVLKATASMQMVLLGKLETILDYYISICLAQTAHNRALVNTRVIPAETIKGQG